MKKAIFLGIVFIVFAGACNKVKQLADINVDFPFDQMVNVPAVNLNGSEIFSPGGLFLPFPAVPVASNSKQQMANYNTAAEKVVKVDLKRMALTIVSPPEENFNYLDNVQLYLSANNLPEVLIAYQYNIPKGQNTLNLETVTGVNLKDYYLQDTIYLRMTAHINALPAQSGEQLKISTVFHMLANPLN